MTEDNRAALDEWERLVEQRGQTLALQAIRDGEPWTVELGRPPRDPRQRDVWLGHAATVAAYRDRYGITGPQSVGSTPRTAAEPEAQKADEAVARAAIVNARRLATHRPDPEPYGPNRPTRSSPDHGPWL